MTISIGTAVGEPGQKASGSFTTAETRDGSPIETPVKIVNGTENGPTIWVQGGIHGNEYVGSVAVLDVWQEINPENVKGAIIFVPALNISAFWHEQRGSPFEKKYNLDLNRVFPGSKNGKFSQYIANEIFDIFTDTADYLLDFHTGSHPDTRWALYTNIKGVSEEAAELGKEVGFPFLLETEVEGEALPLGGSMFIQGALKGIPGVIIESGSKGAVDPAALKDAKQAIYNFSKAIGVLNGTPEPISDRVVELTDWEIPVASKGGRLFCDSIPGDEFEEGDVLGHVEDFDGNVVEEFVAPFDGYVLMSNNTPFVGSGEGIFQLGY